MCRVFDSLLAPVSHSEFSKSEITNCRWLYSALMVLRNHGRPVRLRDVEEAILSKLTPTDYELDLTGVGDPRWKRSLSIMSLAYKNVGLIIKTKAGWVITEKGLDFLSKYSPVELHKEVLFEYREFERKRRASKA
jgi:hypothetical protein